MIFKNTAGQGVVLYAVDATTGLPKPGDSANMTFYASKDDGAVVAIAAAAGVPTEVDATNARGSYKIALTQAETNADKVLFSGKSSTPNVVVVPLTIYTIPASIALLANLDAAISTRLATAGYTDPPADYQQRSVAVTLPTMPANWLTASGLSDGAVAELAGAAGSPPFGTVVIGSTASVVTLSDMQSGSDLVGQMLLDAAAAEFRRIASHTMSGNNYEIHLGTGEGQLGPFSNAPEVSDRLFIVPGPTS